MMTHAVGLRIRRSCWWLALLVSVAVVSGRETFATGGSNMSLSADEEAQIRKTVEAIDDEEPAGVLK